MATVHRFEDLECWKKARQLANAAYEVGDKLSGTRDFALRDQLRRSAISVMANIAEGFERGGAKEFINFLTVARGSLAETKSHLYLAFDLGYLDEKRLQELINFSGEIMRQIGALIGYLQKTEFTGTKFVSHPNRKP
jgi:four helix bundle protein